MAAGPRAGSRGPRPSRAAHSAGADPATPGDSQAPGSSSEGATAAPGLPPIRQAVTADVTGYVDPVTQATEVAMRFATANWLAVASVRKLTETMKQAAPEMHRFAERLQSVKTSTRAKPQAAVPATAPTASRPPKGR